MAPFLPGYGLISLCCPLGITALEYLDIVVSLFPGCDRSLLGETSSGSPAIKNKRHSLLLRQQGIYYIHFLRGYIYCVGYMT